METLSREILRWIQSLDLSSSVKNVKRADEVLKILILMQIYIMNSDFSNGFLVAEIFSRYFPKDITMHSFNNGTCLSKKSDNWKQLLLLFRKFGFEMEGEVNVVQNIISCSSNGIIPLLNAIYRFLTARTICSEVYSRANPRNIPNQYINDELEPDDLSAVIPSLEETENKYEDLGSPMSQEETATNRGDLTGRTPSKVLRGAKRTVGKEGPQKQITVKEVHIKEVDGCISKLRQKKTSSQSDSVSMSENGLLTEGSESWNQSGENKTGSSSASSLYSTILNQTSTPVELLNNIIKSVLPHMKSSRIPLFSYMEAIHKGELVAEDIIEVTNRIFETIPSFALAIFGNPAQYHHLASILIESFDYDFRNDTYASKMFGEPIRSASLEEIKLSKEKIFDTIIALGSQLADIDCFVSCNLFSDFVFPLIEKWFTVASSSNIDGKRLMAVLIMEAHCPMGNFSHTKVTQFLRDQLLSTGNLNSFILCTATLLSEKHTQHYILDVPDSTLAFNDDLVSLYKHYALLGLSSSSGAVRAASICILRFIINVAGLGEELLSILDRIGELVDDSCWEVRAQITITCVAVLQQKTDSNEDNLDQKSVSVIQKLFSSSEGMPTTLTNVIIFAVTPILNKYRELIQRYFETLISIVRINPDILSNIFDLGDSVLAVESASELQYTFRMTGSVLPMQVLLEVLTDLIRAKDSLSDSKEMLNIFNALILSTTKVDQLQDSVDENDTVNVDSNNQVDWEETFIQISDFLFKCLCRDKCGDSALKCIKHIALSSSELGKIVTQHPLWCHSLHSIYSDASDEFAISVTETMVDIFSSDKECMLAGKAMLAEMFETYPNFSNQHIEILTKATSE